MADPSHVRKDYATDAIVVHWDSGQCVHSANCLRALGVVFDTRRRPWIRPDQAGADEVAAAVDTCPSRALTYSRLDGAALGVNGVPAMLCRCGGSANKPFCDGTHKRIGFEAGG